MYYTSNERDQFKLSADIFNSENKHKSKRIYTEMYLFYFYFSIVHISSNNVLGSLKFYIHVDYTHIELRGNCVSVLLFILCQKNG